MTSNEALKQEGWKILNKCPVCGSKLDYCAMMSLTLDSQIKLDGTLSAKSRRSEIGTMECGFISCKNPKCDFVTDCDLESDNHRNIKIKNNDGTFVYREEDE